MLDKSIPFKNVIMRRDAPGPFFSEPQPPKEFFFHFYKGGDEDHQIWIETSGLDESIYHKLIAAMEGEENHAG